MDINDMRHQLRALFEEGTQHAQTLLGLIERERVMLTRNDWDALEVVVGKKRVCVEALENVDIAQKRLTATWSDDASPLSIDALLGHLDSGQPESERVTPAWKEMLDLLRHVQRANAVNGVALNLRQRQAKQALALLSGHADQPVYGPAGDPSAWTAPASRSFGAA
ncbi:MAG: flagellar protein FlgN [Pseudomonadota bacterium]|nr:flagellar protein FlgN [Pseudomonadota bacterium]